jgi:hypothetical protein
LIQIEARRLKCAIEHLWGFTAFCLDCGERGENIPQDIMDHGSAIFWWWNDYNQTRLYKLGKHYSFKERFRYFEQEAIALFPIALQERARQTLNETRDWYVGSKRRERKCRDILQQLATTGELS